MSGWFLYNRSPDSAAREPGRGAPQARVPDHGERAPDGSPPGEPDLHDAAAGRVAGVHLSLPQYGLGALDLPGRRAGVADGCVCAVYEEVLSFA